MVEEILPSAEFVFIRQVLWHLSNADIIKVINKVKQKYRYLIVTEHIPPFNFLPNLDKQVGSNIRQDFNSCVVLTAYPFNLEVKLEKTLCEISGYGGIIQTKLYNLN